MLEYWRTSIAVLLVAVAAGTGCGGDDDEGGSGSADTPAASEQADERVAAETFAAAFQKETGVKLESDKSSTWVTLDAGTGSDTFGEYGAFTIYVLSSVDQGLDILTDDDKGNQVEADADGIYWAQADSGSWAATKLFGNNVVVVWQAGDEKQTDDRWDRLVAAIEKSVDSAGS